MTTDQETLNRIVNDLSSNLIIEAGAGAGKTYALVSRVVALIKGGARMRDIVAITFTEAAANELSERVRSRIEQLLDEHNPANDGDLLAEGMTRQDRGFLERAVAEFDEASVQTIHSFAAQLLRERPLDAGLPPGWVNLDEIADSERFSARWDEWLEWALGSGEGVPCELRASLRYLAGSESNNMENWKSLARAICEDLHRFPSNRHTAEHDLAEEIEFALSALRALASECSNPAADKLYWQLSDAIQTVEAVHEVRNDALAAAGRLKEGNRVVPYKYVGSERNWGRGKKETHGEFREVGCRFKTTVEFAPLAPLLKELERFAREYESARKSDGAVNFRDMLVWTRDMLRDKPEARAQLQRRYSHILIDEFQDTDPLQAEIAFYLAAEPDAKVRGRRWQTLPLMPGKLFVVGDDKQAIYRFRGADMGVAQAVKDGGRLSPLSLSENRRSQKPILDWVNAVFGEGRLMTHEAGMQARYSALTPNDALQSEDVRSSVQLFGDQTDLAATPTRREEAEALARIIISAVSDGAGGLKVYDKDSGKARKATLGDVCILMRTRTGLNALTLALEKAGIPYRIEGGSLLFDTQEVRDLLNCLRAIDDPSDAVSAVAALRSPAFACSDLDLLRWRDASGPWNYRSPLLRDERLSDDNSEPRRVKLADDSALASVRSALLKLREYHDRRQSAGVSRLISEFISERRLDELDLVERRPREAWRRRRFLTEQARTLEFGRMASADAQPLSLRQFLQWVELQQDENARIAEVVVPDTDDAAARIMTIHAAKGLEFPITFVLGLAGNPQSRRLPLLFDSDTKAPEMKLGGFSSVNHSALHEVEKEHNKAETIRLAYVAATRARDHLFFSMYRARTSKGVTAQIEEMLPKLEELHRKSDAGTANALEAKPDAFGGHETEEYAPGAWQAERADAFRRRSLPRAITATALAKKFAADAKKREQIEDKDKTSDTEQMVFRGRGGTAFGSALHAILQEAIEMISDQLPPGDASNLDDLLIDNEDAVRRLAEIHAAALGLSSSRGDLERLALRTLRHPAIKAALMAPRLWSEIPVAGRIETERGPVVIEGIIDLLYQDADGNLVIVDHKSDYVSGSRGLEAKLDLYKWQGAAYALAARTATGMEVKDVKLLFVRANKARSVRDLDLLISQLPQALNSG